MDLTLQLAEPAASLAPLLEIVCDVAADAARQADPDTCLRRLRFGLIRLGFSRAGIGIAEVDNPANWHGTWGTGWDGAELDEHRSTWDVRTLPGFAKILNGERLSLNRVDLPADHQVIAPRELDLNEVIDRVGIMLRRVIGENITLHTYSRPDWERSARIPVRSSKFS